jgi:hypothetical protein
LILSYRQIDVAEKYSELKEGFDETYARITDESRGLVLVEWL